MDSPSFLDRHFGFVVGGGVYHSCDRWLLSYVNISLSACPPKNNNLFGEAYSFLDPRKEHGFLAIYIVGIAVGEIIVFAIVYGVCFLREKIAGKVGRGIQRDEEGGAGGFSRGEVQMQEIDEWEDIEREEVGGSKNVS